MKMNYFNYSPPLGFTLNFSQELQLTVKGFGPEVMEGDIHTFEEILHKESKEYSFTYFNIICLFFLIFLLKS